MADGDEVIQLSPSAWCIGQKKGGRVHAFLLDDGKELTLVDTLFDSDGARVLQQLEQLGRKPEDLKHIVITHGHRSHLGGLAALKAATGATVYSHEWEADIIGGERKAQAVRLLPRKPYRVYLPFQFCLAVGWGAHTPCPVDHFVAGGDRVGPLHLIDAAGHSPGHLAFLWPEQGVLIAGDSVATWPSLAAGWASFNLNVRKHHDTIRRLADTEPDIVGVGHGSPIATGGHAKLRQLADAIPR